MPTTHNIAAIVLAASRGTQMKGDRSKVLYELCGRPMIHYVVEAAIQAGVTDVFVVTDSGQHELTGYLSQAFGERVHVILQEGQLGTRHDVLSALPMLSQAELVYVLRGDAPLLDLAELSSLREAMHSQVQTTVLMRDVGVAGAHRHIFQDALNNATEIGERCDHAAAAQMNLQVDSSAYLCRPMFLHDAIAEAERANAEEPMEFNDVIAIAAKNHTIVGVPAQLNSHLLRVNDRIELAAAEDNLFVRIADNYRRAGAAIHGNPRIDATVIIEPDAIIEHGVVLRGTTHIGSGARIDVGAILTDVIVAPGAIVRPYSVCTSASIGESAEVGPLSHVRPASEIGANARIGNFVETKNVILRRGVMANHLAFLGDGDVGEGAIIGAGTIFCNSDGINKFKTEVGAGAFVGSDSQLVAPVKIGAGAFVATGTTVTRDVPADALAIARLPQVNKEGYATGLRDRAKAEKARRGT